MQTFKEFLDEDGVPANCAGGGQIAGLGIQNPDIPNQAEPGGRKAKLALLKRRKPK